MAGDDEDDLQQLTFEPPSLTPPPELDEPRTTVFSQAGVDVYPTESQKLSGLLTIDKTSSGAMLSWSPDFEDDWAQAYQFAVCLDDVRALRRFLPSFMNGGPRLVVLLSNGVALAPLHFSHGGLPAFFAALEASCALVRSPDESLWVNDASNPQQAVSPPPPDAAPSLADVGFTLLEGLGQITRLAKSMAALATAHLPAPPTPTRLSPHRETAAIGRGAAGDGLLDGGPGPLPPLPAASLGAFELVGDAESDTADVHVVTRPPITLAELADAGAVDVDGRWDEDKLRAVILAHPGVGLHPTARAVAWPVLLGATPASATNDDRATGAVAAASRYARLRSAWADVLPEQEARNRVVRERRHRVDKDVVRTDREISFYGDTAEGLNHVESLRSILYTYTLSYNFDLGYCQGLNDFLAPLLYVLGGDEPAAFFAFAALLERRGFEANFKKDQAGMTAQLVALERLLRVLDPPLASHLAAADATHCFFAFRWLVLAFKREFSYGGGAAEVLGSDRDGAGSEGIEGEPLLALWDHLLSKSPASCPQLFYAAAALIRNRGTILSERLAFDELLRLTNGMAGRIDVHQLLRDAAFLESLAGDVGKDITADVYRALVGVGEPSGAES